MISELARAARPRGTVALYVWDLSGGQMELITRFWQAVSSVDPGSAALAEANRFREICAPEPLRALLGSAGLGAVETRAIDVPTVFRDFEDYWTPFLGGQGPAAAYLVSISEERRNAIRERLRASVPAAADGSLPLTARAWAVRGTKP
jgi:hypothetical protein